MVRLVGCEGVFLDFDGGSDFKASPLHAERESSGSGKNIHGDGTTG
jgi:hypothetical protein